MSVGRRHARLVIGLAIASAFVTSSCFDDAVGPQLPYLGRFAVAPSFASAGASIIPISSVRIVLERPGDTTLAVDTVFTISADQDSVSLALTVPMHTQTETFTLNLALIGPAGDTVFRGGPISVTPTSGGGETIPTVSIPLVYTGVGANATRVTILTSDAGVFFGDTVVVDAEAYDASNAPIPGTPIVWSSLDPARATVPDPAVGRVVGQSQRGAARIVATLLTGPADTGQVAVQPLPSALTIVSGDAQTAPIASVVEAPLTVGVTAADGLGVRGVLVRFLADNGSVSADSVVTDSAGLASTTWTLGTVAGAQSVRAVVTGLADSVATFTATGIAVAADSLAFAVEPTSTAAGTALAVEVQLYDSFGNPATGDNTTAVTIALVSGTGAAGAALGGTTTVTAAGGVAQFTDLTLDLAASGYRLAAAASGLAPDTTAAFDITAGAPAAISVVSGEAQSAPVTTSLADSLAVFVEDQYGNTTSGITVLWEVVAGGGAITPIADTTDTLGQAYATWTLGATVGTQTVRAVVAGLADTAAFDATALITGVTAQWTGATNTDWATGTNWFGGTVPTSADTAYVPAAAPNQPALTGTATVGDLTVETGASLTLANTTDSLIMFGSLDAGYTSIAGAGTVVMEYPGTLRGAVPNLAIQFQVTAVDSVTVNGNLTLSGEVPALDLNGHRVHVTDSLIQNGYPGVLMNNPADSLVVDGSVLWQYADPTQLTAGTMQVAGDFTVAYTGFPYYRPDTTGTHKLVFDGTGTQTLTLQGGGPGSSTATNYLLFIEVQPGATVTSSLPAYIERGLNDPNGGWQVNNTAFTGGQLTVLGSPAPPSSSFETAVSQVLQAGSFTLQGDVDVYSNLSFGDPGTGGTTMRVTGQLTNNNYAISMHDDADSLIVDGDLFLYGTYSADTALTGGVWIARGNVEEDGGPGIEADPAGTHRFVMDGTSTQLLTLFTTQPMLRDLEITGSADVQLDYDLQVKGTVIVSGTALFEDPNGYTATIGQDLITTAGGRFGQSNASSTFIVARNAVFDGGSTSGLLTAGTLEVGADFTQMSTTSALSFAADAAHTTQFSADLGTQRITFDTPDSVAGSHFGNLAAVQVVTTGGGDTLQLNTRAFANGSVALGDNNGDYPLSVTGPGEIITRGNVVFTQTGAGIDVTPAAVRLAGTLQLSSFAGDTGFSPTVAEFFGGNGQRIPYWTKYQTVLVTGDSVTSSDTSGTNIWGDLIIAGNGLLHDGGGDWTVNGNLVTQDNGALRMDNANSALGVVGNVTFGGGSTVGRLTDGWLSLGGDFTQTGSPTSFAASGNHRVRFGNNSAQVQNVSFANPDTSASHFASLELIQSGTIQGVALQSSAVALGDFIAPVGGPQQSMAGNGNRLTVGGLNTNNVRLDHVLFTWTDVGVFTGVFTQFSSIAFVNYAATDTQFNILHDGSQAAFNMSGLTFGTLPTTGVGYYVKAEDPGYDILNTLIVNLGFFLNSTSVPDTQESGFLSHLDPVPPAQLLYSWS